MAKQEVPKSIRASLYIDGKPAEHSIKNVEQVARTLRKELNGLAIGTDEWNQKMKQVQANSAHLQNIKKEVNGVSGAFGILKTELGKVGSMAAGYLGFQFVTSQFQNLIANSARLSDSLADIRQYAGLTEVEVRKLDKSLGSLDTRTSKSGLREIAVVAGRLGVAKDDIVGFVEATDMLVVALGAELGNADQVTTQLGKILNVFDGEVTGDNITRLGNAMVKLANDGVASAPFIADFTQRVSGIAKTAKMALGPTLGLAAGLEELGARPESAATAIQKLLVSIGQDVPAAAKVAKKEFGEFNQLFDKSPELALLAYAEGLTQNKTAFSDITAAFKDAGEEGMKVIETITKLGERSDFIRGKFDDGTTSLQGYNEIQDAFALKNENLGSGLDKLRKAFNMDSVSLKLMGFFVSIVEVTTKVIEGISGVARETESLYQVFTKQERVVKSLESNLVPLIEKYDELIKKGNKSEEEQAELNTTIGKIANILPEAATEFDKYGTAIAVSTSKAREFIETQKALLKYKNMEALSSAKEDLEDYNSKIEKIQHTLKTGRSNFAQDLLFPNSKLDLRDDVRSKLVLELAMIGDLKKGAEAYIKTLSGEDIEIKKVESNTTTDGGNTGGGSTGGGDKGKEGSIKKEQESLRKWLQKNQEDMYIDSLIGAEKELAVIYRKYDDQRKAAHNNTELLKQIDKQEEQDFQALLDKLDQAKYESDSKQAVAQAAAYEKIFEAGMTEREKELYAIEQHYDELLKLAEEFGLDSTSIVQRYEEAKKELKSKNETKDLEDQKKKEKDKKDKETQEQKDKDKKAQEEREKRFGFAVGAAQEVADSVFSIQQNNRRTELEAKLSSIDSEREKLLSNENLTQEQKKAINDRFDAKIKLEKKKAFDADRKASISQAIINGLLGVSQLWIKPGFPAAIPLAAMLGAKTAASIAVMASQKAPEYAFGGFSDEDPQGYVSSTTLFNNSASGRPFVAGEAGKEWIAPNWMVTDPKFANIIGMLETARQSKRMFAGGGSTQIEESNSKSAAAYNFTNIESLMVQMIEAFHTAQNKKTYFVYKEYEEFKTDIVYTRKTQGMP